MSDYIRDPSTNTSMPCTEGLKKLRAHLDGKNNEIFIKVARECGVNTYPSLMRVLGSLDFEKAHLFNREPQKNNC